MTTELGDQDRHPHTHNLIPRSHSLAHQQPPPAILRSCLAKQPHAHCHGFPSSPRVPTWHAEPFHAAAVQHQGTPRCKQHPAPCKHQPWGTSLPAHRCCANPILGSQSATRAGVQQHWGKSKLQAVWGRGVSFHGTYWSRREICFKASLAPGFACKTFPRGLHVLVQSCRVAARRVDASLAVASQADPQHHFHPML